MKKVTLSLLSLSILTANALPVWAAIFPDQIVYDSGGEDRCRPGYRPLTRDEATLQRDYLVSQMGEWQITGLKDDWVIMGPGYHGRIKQDLPNSTTWCYPIEHSAIDIPEYSPYTLPEGEEVDVQYSLVSDQSQFIRPLSYLAHYLGFAWLGGNSSNFIGEDMSVRKEGDEWIIQGNNAGPCDGYRCDEKTKITVSNFAYILNSKDFWHGEVTESDKKLVKTISAIARNHSDHDQQVVINLKVDESTNWSKTNSFGFSESVQTKNEFQWPLVGSTELTIKLEANQSWANTNGGASTETVTLESRPMVPAHSELPIRVELYRSSISYPYRFGADVSYDVAFDGFMRWSGNAWHTHPKNRPTIHHVFSMGRAAKESADIRSQWNERHIPGASQWWDWSWAIQENGLDNMRYATGASLRPYRAQVSGDFYAESQYAGTVDIGEARPISLTSRAKRSLDDENNRQQLQDGSVELISNFDADELDALGFGNAEMVIKAVH